MNNRYFQFFAFIFAFVLFCVSFPASAQTYSTSGGYSGLDHINRIIAGTPGITVTSVTGGVNASASGAVNFRSPTGLNIPVPTTVTAKATGAAVALGAGRLALRVLPWVGAAIAIKEIADAVKKEGISVCPPPDFFCKPAPAGIADPPLVPYSWQQQFGATKFVSSPVADCETLAKQMSSAYYGSVYYPTPTSATCDYRLVSTGNVTTAAAMKYLYMGGMTCPSGTTQSGGTCIINGPMIQAPETDLQTALNAQFAKDATLIKKMYEQQKAVEAASPGIAPIIPPANLTLTMNAPPVTSPAMPVSTETVTNPDGTTSTKTVSKQTTITPTMAAGATAAAPSITFPNSTVITTSIVNNTTNVTNVTTQTEQAQSENVEKPEPMPKDYNREATQQKILQQLDGSTIGDAPADQQTRVDTKVAEVDTNLNAEMPKIPTQFDADKGNWFSWVWVPPMSQCSSSLYSTTVRGQTVAWDICPWVENIRQLVGFIWAFIGCLSIYSQMFKRGD